MGRRGAEPLGRWPSLQPGPAPFRRLASGRSVREPGGCALRVVFRVVSILKRVRTIALFVKGLFF